MGELSNWAVRFFSKVKIDSKTGCWLWQASLTHNGYARFSFGRKTVRAHRFLYERLIGPIPKPLEPDHLCRTRNCVAPFHLEVVTKKTNIGRRLKGYRRTRKTHCKRGHSFKGNYVYKGSVHCRQCAVERLRKWREVKHS